MSSPRAVANEITALLESTVFTVDTAYAMVTPVEGSTRHMALLVVQTAEGDTPVAALEALLAAIKANRPAGRG
jgi:hypothetical protein